MLRPSPIIARRRRDRQAVVACVMLLAACAVLSTALWLPMPAVYAAACVGSGLMLATSACVLSIIN